MYYKHIITEAIKELNKPLGVEYYSFEERKYPGLLPGSTILELTIKKNHNPIFQVEYVFTIDAISIDVINTLEIDTTNAYVYFFIEMTKAGIASC